MQNALLQVNLTPEKVGLASRFPRCFRKSGLKQAAKSLLAYAYGLGARKDKKTGEILPIAPFKTTYKQLHEELGLCKETIANAAKQLEEKKILKRSRNEDGTTSFEFVCEVDVTKGYDFLPLYLNTVKVRLGGTGPWRKIPFESRRVLAHFMDEGEKLGERRCAGSISSISRKLGMPRSTVHDAIHFLLNAGVITLKDSDKGDRKNHKHSVYYVSDELYKYKDEGKLARMSPAAQERFLAKRRKDYYEVKQPKAREEAARKYSSWIDGNKELQALKRSLSKLELDAAKAELGRRGARPLADVQAEQSQVSEALQALLVSLEYDERRRHPEYYIRCGCCHDTGQLSGGAPCMCWKRAVLW